MSERVKATALPAGDYDVVLINPSAPTSKQV